MDNVRQLVKDEIEDMRKQMRDDPHSEPEPNAWRFDAMTQEERYYIAEKLGL
jgi:hypothetical protein